MPTIPIDGWEDAVLEDVTPEMARRWIRHSHQRALDLVKPRKLLDDIAAGKWDPINHRRRPVVVSVDKEILADGHHRIQTVLMHGEPIPMYVLYKGLHRE